MPDKFSIARFAFYRYANAKLTITNLPLTAALYEIMKVQIEGNPKELLKSIIKVNSNGELNLGLSGVSMEPAKLSDLFERDILFRDYLMEGFVKFHLKATSTPQGLELSVKSDGGNRDQYLGSHFEFIFKQVGKSANIV